MNRHDDSTALTPTIRGALTLTVAFATVLAAGCGSRVAQGGEDAGAGQPDARSSVDGHKLHYDIPPLVDAMVDAMPVDSGAPCFCPTPDEVMLIGSCVPTDKLETCAPTCDPSTPSSCPGNPGEQRCDPSAATPSCVTSSTRPACVPGMGMGFSPGTLRIYPREGNAAQEAKLTISGGSLYIGALWWSARMGPQKPVPLSEVTSQPCRYPVTLRPPGPGIHPVEIAYGAGGGGGGGKGWVLAGFYTGSGGSVPPKAAQPGERCSASLPCASAAPYSCACVSGRCQCERQ